MQKTDSSGYIFNIAQLGFPLKLSIVFGLSVFALFAVGGSVRYAASLPKTQPNQSQNQNNSQNQTAPGTNQQNAPTITQPQNSGSSSGGTTQQCSSSRRATFTTQYNSQIASENARHQNALNFLTSTGASSAAFAAENATYSANISSINSQYQSNLRSIGC